MSARTSRVALCAAALALASAGCAQRTMYHWGRYDNALYRHYRNPQDRVAYVEELQALILEADQHGQRVPPGVCAEYGYALYEQGRQQEAVPWFQRERDQWPESRILMDKMIRNAQQRGARQPGPTAGAPERTP